MSAALLEVRDLHAGYGAIRALQGVSLRVEEGQIVTLIGCNGAGKSTTLRTISGLVRPSKGEIEYLGASIASSAPHRIVRAGISHAPEGRGIFANLSVAENLELGGYARHDRDALRGDRERVLALFPRLAERYEQNAGTLSGGEQQMLAIGRALMARPRLLMLDEPSLGLAPQLVQTIFRTLREINAAGTTILLVEQNAHMALEIAHYGYVLEVGRTVLGGPARELAGNNEVRRAYLGGH